MPEIDLKLPLSQGMTALITARLSKAAAHEAAHGGAHLFLRQCLFHGAGFGERVRCPGARRGRTPVRPAAPSV